MKTWIGLAILWALLMGAVQGFIIVLLASEREVSHWNLGRWHMAGLLAAGLVSEMLILIGLVTMQAQRRWGLSLIGWVLALAAIGFPLVGTSLLPQWSQAVIVHTLLTVVPIGIMTSLAWWSDHYWPRL